MNKKHWFLNKKHRWWIIPVILYLFCLIGAFIVIWPDEYEKALLEYDKLIVEYNALARGSEEHEQRLKKINADRASRFESLPLHQRVEHEIRMLPERLKYSLP
ncbi:MAG: hypothetical protein OXN17_16130 [Candidatus Poribacteria bacterium]|nr:hypothetical protein [Candidatus Poribacteria bacterium]MDE0504585.1 hypothetical protein [Candidatus Poribacteria bacterium]